MCNLATIYYVLYKDVYVDSGTKGEESCLYNGQVHMHTLQYFNGSLK